MIKAASAIVSAALIAANVALGADMQVLKVQALADGSIALNGRHTTVDVLRKFLADAHGQTVVWYYREHADQEPTQGQMNVIQAIVDNKVPVSLSTKPDFSDVVGEDGVPHPRK
jgi:hypothetical protein